MRIVEVAYYKQKTLFNLYLLVFFSAITFILYYNSLNNFFVLDDFGKLSAISQGLLAENFHFFPLPQLTYRVLYSFFGMNPVPMRILNFILNALTCVIVFRFSSVLFFMFAKHLDDNKNFLISFFASLLFCIHYIHVETIVYYSELHEMFYSIFYLSGLYIYLRYKDSSKNINLLIVYALYLFCILSKETAITFILCLFISERFLFKNNIKNFIKEYYPLMLITFGFSAIRYFFYSSLAVLDMPDSILIAISVIIKNYLFSLTAFFFSLDFIHLKNIFNENNANIVKSFFRAINIYPLSVISVIVSLLIYGLILIKSVKLNYILFIFSVISISSYAWLAGYERYLYLPSVSLCILLVYNLFEIKIFSVLKKIPIYFILVVLIIYNVVNLKEKESHWIIASEISRNTVSRIIELTCELPPESKVYFKDLPGEYKSAWVLRYGIHELPSLFLQRNDIKFYYLYQKPDRVNIDSNSYEYDYSLDKIYKL